MSESRLFSEKLKNGFDSCQCHVLSHVCMRVCWPTLDTHTSILAQSFWQVVLFCFVVGVYESFTLLEF